MRRERKCLGAPPVILKLMLLVFYNVRSERAATQRTEGKQIFPDTLFAYDAATDTYCCPAGNTLKRKSLHQHRESIDYAASKSVCDACELRAQCTRNKAGRSIKRHLRQEALDAMRSPSRSPQAKRDIRTRQQLMERSFARGTRFGFDHARWRGRNKVQIQEYLSAAIQNIEVLVRYGGDPRQRAAALQWTTDRLSDLLRQARAITGNLFPCRAHTIRTRASPTVRNAVWATGRKGLTPIPDPNTHVRYQGDFL